MEDRLTHAGGVVFRRDGPDPQYLLVSAKRYDEWVLPKGHIESGEHPEQAALREVREETGVVARVHARLPGNVSFEVDGERISVAFFLMEWLRQERSGEHRKAKWLPIAAAVASATHEETRLVLKHAEALRVALA